MWSSGKCDVMIQRTLNTEAQRTQNRKNLVVSVNSVPLCFKSRKHQSAATLDEQFAEPPKLEADKQMRNSEWGMRTNETDH